MRQREDALKQREESSRKRLSEELDSQVREARKQIDGVIAKLKQKTQALADEAARRTINTGASGAARIEAREAVDAVVEKLLQPVDGASTAPQQPSAPISVGARVSVGTLGLEGVVTSLHDGAAEVDVRGKRYAQACGNCA